MALRLGLAALAATLITPAFAAEPCGPLQLLTSVLMTAQAGGSVKIVPVTVNGTIEHMLLDTGGFTAQLSRTAVEELKLPTRESDLKLLDVNGNASNKTARVAQFGIGNLLAKDVEIEVSPIPNLGQHGIDGILSTDFLRGYDVDLDFGGSRINYIKPDHCEGHVVYWKPAVLAIVSMHLIDGHIIIPITVDGHDFSAMIDTGSTRSTMAQQTAKAVYGLDPDAPGTIQGGAVNGDTTLRGFLHVFSSLSFEGVTVRNPHILILPNKVGARDVDNGYEGSHVHHYDDDIVQPEVVVGMDVLKHLHLYIAYRESRLYITEAGSGAAPPTPASDATQ